MALPGGIKELFFDLVKRNNWSPIDPGLFSPTKGVGLSIADVWERASVRYEATEGPGSSTCPGSLLVFYRSHAIFARLFASGPHIAESSGGLVSGLLAADPAAYFFTGEWPLTL